MKEASLVYDWVEAEMMKLWESWGKIKKLIEWGNAKDLIVFADYDWTITKRFIPAENGELELGITAFGFIEKYSKFPQSYHDKTGWYHTHYFGIENDGSLTVEEKTPHMIEWYEKVINLTLECAKDMPDFSLQEWVNENKHKILIREGVKELIELCYAKDIPFVIISWGWADVIEVVLETFGIDKRHYTIWSNRMLFENEKLVGWSKPLLHMYNKKLCWGITPDNIMQIAKSKKV